MKRRIRNIRGVVYLKRVVDDDGALALVRMEESFSLAWARASKREPRHKGARGIENEENNSRCQNNRTSLRVDLSKEESERASSSRICSFEAIEEPRPL
jgi:hypothetical protein